MRHLHPARIAGTVAPAFARAVISTLTPLTVSGVFLAALTLPATAAQQGASPQTSTSTSTPTATPTASGDPRIREIRYDPNAVVTLPVKRGVVTHLILGADEAITDVATGLGADCSKPETSWCIAAQPGGHQVFIKPKSTATAANTLAIATDKRVHTLRLVLLAEGDRRTAIYRLQILPPLPAHSRSVSGGKTSAGAYAGGGLLLPRTLSELTVLADQATAADGASRQEAEAQGLSALPLEERLSAAPQVLNDRYSLSEGSASGDIVPTAIFDDGRFTYFRFPNNREVPAVFHVQPDGVETMVNARMEGDLLAVDRVSRHLVLRAGSAVVGIWNDAFDLDGQPPRDGTTVDGVRRTLLPAPTPDPATRAQQPGSAPAAHQSTQRGAAR